MSGAELLAIAQSLGLIMLAVAVFVAAACIVANEYFKRHGLPDDGGDE